MTSPSIGVLLINLGTPASSHPRDVKRYLHEFLTDRNVIDLPWVLRQLLVRGVIVPRRYRSSAALYKRIWTPEGSPLLVHGRRLRASLQKELGDEFYIHLAMRYGAPSLRDGLDCLSEMNLSKIVILPLFPQFSTATTGSIYVELFKLLSSYSTLPALNFIQSYATDPGFIAALCAQVERLDLSSYDHIFLSYHGLPQDLLMRASPRSPCLQRDSCCATLKKENRHCYAAQCWETTRGIVRQLNLKEDQFTHCYQSRLGKKVWLRPYMSDLIARAPKEGKKRVLVFCPSFVADCLETLSEIEEEYRHLFYQNGGETLHLAEGLNASPKWVAALKKLILKNL